MGAKQKKTTRWWCKTTQRGGGGGRGGGRRVCLELLNLVFWCSYFNYDLLNPSLLQEMRGGLEIFKGGAGWLSSMGVIGWMTQVMCHRLYAIKGNFYICHTYTHWTQKGFGGLFTTAAAEK